MALILAPYNEAMRIGMGFNSYTQSLCIDDCVRRKDGSKASEASLRTVDPSKGGVDGTVSKKVNDGQSDVSQVVSWKAGFVENVSDLNKTLNISGALAIKVEALNASASASAHYITTNTENKSDIQYSIIVKVTNQKLVAEDVTQFVPIEHVPESKFQEVYGDCFISGFLEGGILNGLISKKLFNDSDATDIGGELQVAMELKVASVSGSAKGDYKNKKTSGMVDTQVSVTWSGGGDIKPDDVKEWDIPSLTKVAMEFPDRAAACPQRTFAILTKYTALRSYHEKTVKGSPMDYEIAGIYTNSLLDSYLGYKEMWAELQTLIKEMSQGKSNVKKRSESDQLVKYKAEPQKDYDDRMVKYNAAKDALVKSGTQNQIILEEPLPANKVVPYEANDFGLDQAQRECRFEMIKIVREINDVTYNPQVATDPNRKWRYLSPAIFRLLLPTDKAAMLTTEEIEELKKRVEDAKKELEAEVEKNTQLAKEKKVASDAAQATTREISTKLTTAETERNAYRDGKNQAEGSLMQLSKDYKQLTESMDARDKLTIIRVEYGGKSMKGRIDIYDKVFNDISKRNVSITLSNEYFGGDPTPGLPKYAVIAYQWKGRYPVYIEAKEGANVQLREGETEELVIPTHEIASKG